MKKQIQLLIMLGLSNALAIAKIDIVGSKKPNIIWTEAELKQKQQRARNHFLERAAVHLAAVHLGVAVGFLARATEITAEINREFFEKHTAALNQDFGNLNA